MPRHSDENRPTQLRAVPGSYGVKVEKRFEYRLLVVLGEEVRSHRLFGDRVLSVGRSQEADIPIFHSTISRRHANIILGPTILVEDCQSLNGVFIGGRKLKPGERVEFQPGDIVEMGDAMLMLQQKVIIQKLRQVQEHQDFARQLKKAFDSAEQGETAFAIMFARAAESVPADILQDAINHSLRGGDVVARNEYGEYEFFFPDTTVAMAESVRRTLTEHLGRYRADFQSGVACFPRDANQMDGLIAKARDAMGENAPSEEEGPVVLEDEYMQQLRRLIERIAPSDICVIIQGETGVGKEVVARMIHHFSRRPEELFISVNCAALPDSLLESELFGHERGAFTGALKSKPGLLEVAKNGTFLLDEVSEMPITLQAKLLRMLEERKAVRVGGIKPYDIHARFIAVSNRDLEVAVEQGSFRRDLFYRLDGISLRIPPLRERIADIEPLTRAYIRQTCRQLGRRDEPIVSPEAMDWLREYAWPGNVRELRNVIERAVLLSTDGRIEEHHVMVERKLEKSASVSGPTVPPPLPLNQDSYEDDDTMNSAHPALQGKRLTVPSQRVTSSSPNLKDEVREIEFRRILEALEQAGGNQTKAAKMLGMSRRTFINRLDEFGIKRPRKGKR